MVNCIFLAHSRKKGERQALCSKEMRCTSDGALRQSAVDEATNGHDLRDPYCSKKQRRAMATLAFSKIALDYKDSDLGVRGESSIAQGRKRLREEHIGWAASVPDRKFKALKATSAHGPSRARKAVPPVFAIAHLAPPTAKAGEKVTKVRGSGTGRANESIKARKAVASKVVHPNSTDHHYTDVLYLSSLPIHRRRSRPKRMTLRRRR